jgi:hypothetical protein
MDIVYTAVWPNGSLDLLGKTRIALQYGQAGTKEEQHQELYCLYNKVVAFPGDAFKGVFKEVRTNVLFEDALRFVAQGVLPSE